MPSIQTHYKLNNGTTIPAIGLGTWKSPQGEVAKAVEHALKSGYTHIDGAWIYGNEKEVGEGIKASGVDRKSIFLTTKIWCTYHTRPDQGLDESLKNLGTDYVDLLLLHWPMPLNPNGSPANVPKKEDGSMDTVENWTILDSWKALEKVYKSGKAKAIGVSNWSQKNLQIILDGGSVKPACNQVELHPYNPQHELVKFCKDNDILLESYSPLGSTDSPILSDPDIVKIAKKHDVSVGTVLISYQLNRGLVVLPKSVTPSRIEQNLKTVEFDEDDMNVLDELAGKGGKQHRFVKPDWGTDFGFDDWNVKSAL
ncbi:aldo-keto reductase [Phaffia rhodozyma]|uniref:Aldo-keto reductase n=1 Tax=Phaffia rhodozyma TaxID=264483 RepID=A0A0F7SLC7_PHARH|nr:aldo-keto reductase [Phaffia rhodozyma]